MSVGLRQSSLGRWVMLGALTALPVLAQGRSQAVRNFNNQILQIHGQSQGANAGQAAQLRNQASSALQQRLAALAALIEENPQEALSLAFPPGLVSQLAAAFPQAAGYLEVHGTLVGEVESWVEDGVNLASHRTRHRVRTGTEALNLFFAPGAEPPGLRSGHYISASGIRAGSNVAAAGGSITGESTASATCSTFGAQNILTILVICRTTR